MEERFAGGHYTLHGFLGSGGMADVYLARDEVLERDVALKILKKQYAQDADFVELFRREARSAASLNHPNIVTIYDWGRSEDETYYMDRKSTRLNSSHANISYAVFCLKKKNSST